MSKKLTNLEFIAKAQAVHQSAYDYSETLYVGNEYPVRVICKTHGAFEQIANTHLGGHGCPACAYKSGAEKRSKGWRYYVEKIGKLQPNLNLVDFENSFTLTTKKVPVKCQNPEHAVFYITPHKLTRGQGCPSCGRERVAASRSITFPEFLARAKVVHGDRYSYRESEYKGYRTKITVVCPEHGEYTQTPEQHATQKHGCPKCASEANRPKRISALENLSKCKEVHGEGSYTYDLESLALGSSTHWKIVCPTHGPFSQLGYVHLRGSKCPSCTSSGVSEGQRSLGKFLVECLTEEGVTPEFRFSESRQRVDYYIPSLNLAIDYDGIYWHSEIYKEDNYHSIRRSEMADKGISYIRIFEDEWLHRGDCVRSMLKSKFGLHSKSGALRASKLLMRQVDASESRSFYETYHIQGFGGGGISFGLYASEVLVACMTFTRRLSDRGEATFGYWELSRFATSRKIHGGASKLLKALLLYTLAKSVVSYSDNRISCGYMYAKLGFTKKHITKPSYSYYKSNTATRIHKSNLRKTKLQALMGLDYDPLKTEREMANSLGYFQVYDDGLTKWQLDVR